MCQQFLHLLLSGGQAHPPNYCIPVLRWMSTQNMTIAWDLMYAQVKWICNFWESTEGVSGAEERISSVLLTQEDVLVLAELLRAQLLCDNGIPVQTGLASPHTQKKKKKMQQGIFSTLSCSTLCFLASTFKLCNNIYTQMLTVIFHPGKRRCHLKVPCVM